MEVMEFKVVVEKYCVGMQYDSCKNSPCPYSSSMGCTEPHIVSGIRGFYMAGYLKALDKLGKPEAIQ